MTTPAPTSPTSRVPPEWLIARTVAGLVLSFPPLPNRKCAVVQASVA